VKRLSTLAEVNSDQFISQPGPDPRKRDSHFQKAVHADASSLMLIGEKAKKRK
jgi:hypothetical protein